MPVNRFSRQRNYATFTPESLEQMSIVPGVYNKQYQDRETAKNLMANLGFNASPFHTDYAKELSQKWTDRIAEDTKQFNKYGFSDPNVRARMDKLVSEYSNLLKTEVAGVNQWNALYQKNIAEYDERAKNAESGEEQTWILAQKNIYAQRASTSALKNEDGTFAVPPSDNFVGWRDTLQELMDLMEESDILKNYRMSDGKIIDGITYNTQGPIIGEKTENRAINAGVSIANAYIGKPDVQRFLIKLHEVYGAESGIKVDKVNGKVVANFITEDKNGIPTFNTDTVIGRDIAAAIEAKFGVSVIPIIQTAKGSRSSYATIGGSIDLGDVPKINVTSSQSNETITDNTYSRIVSQIDKSTQDLNNANIVLESNISSFIESINNSFNAGIVVDSANKDNVETNKALIRDLVWVALKVDTQMINDSMISLFENYGFDKVKANQLTTQILSSEPLLNGLVALDTSFKEIDKIETHKKAAEDVHDKLIKDIEATWQPVLIINEDNESSTTYESFEQLNDDWKGAVDNFISAIERNLNFEDGKIPKSIAEKLFKVNPKGLTEEQIKKELEILRNGVYNSVFQIDYTKNVGSQFENSIMKVNSNLKYMNLDLADTDLGAMFAAIRDFNVDQLSAEGAFYPDRLFNPSAGPDHAGGLLRDLRFNAKNVTYVLSKNMDTIDQMNDTYAAKNMTITVANDEAGEDFMKEVENFAFEWKDNHFIDAKENYPTMSGKTVTQFLRDQGTKLPDDVALDFSDTKFTIGLYTDLETGELVPTLALYGTFGYTDKSGNIEKSVIRGQMHIDMRASEGMYDRLDDMMGKMWFATNARKNLSDADIKAASYMNQFVGKDLLENNDYVVSRFLQKPKKGDTFPLVLKAGDNGPQAVSYLQPILLEARFDTTTGSYEWAVAGNKQSLGVTGNEPSERLSALYQYVGEQLYKNIFG